jgi:DNA-binding MarR family transcriptional regulator
MDDKLDRFIVRNKFIDVRHIIQELQDYLETILGFVPELRSPKVSHLPLFLRNRFSFRSAELFGRQWTLALEEKSWDTASPGEYEKYADLLCSHFEAPLAFVLGSVASSARNRMVQKGIPFIVPGTQCYLPSTLVDLRERFPRQRGKVRTSLSPTAQLTLLYHLQRERLDELPLKTIAEKLHCSAMMLSKVKDELEEAGLCGVERIGRSMALRFTAERRALWDLAQANLSSPIRKIRWVQWKPSGYPALFAGISALSRRTQIADDRIPTYALGPRMLEAWLERGTVTGCPDAEQASARIEVWSYEPKYLGDNESVDPLSLYLSLRYSGDERVQQQLERLIEEVTW